MNTFQIVTVTAPPELELGLAGSNCPGDGCNSDGGGCTHDAGCGQDCGYGQ